MEKHAHVAKDRAHDIDANNQIGAKTYTQCRSRGNSRRLGYIGEMKPNEKARYARIRRRGAETGREERYDKR